MIDDDNVQAKREKGTGKDDGLIWIQMLKLYMVRRNKIRIFLPVHPIPGMRKSW